MDARELRERIRGLNVWKRGGERAPHKPLLLLYALGRLHAGSDRWIPFVSVARDVGRLLEEFGPPRKSIHPEYPFWRLADSRTWWR